MSQVTETLYVDPETALILREIEQAGVPLVSSLSVEAARAQAEEGNRAWNQDPPALASVTELAMPGPAGPIRLRHYRPREAASLPLVIYFHGGGFVLCSLDTHDRVMRLLALDSGAAVIGVDYRMAPEDPFPAPLDDCVAAVRWIRAEAAALGVDPERVVLAGDSAGANLALASLPRARRTASGVLRCSTAASGGASIRLRMRASAMARGGSAAPRCAGSGSTIWATRGRPIRAPSRSMPTCAGCRPCI
jgi:acetyl esterase